MASRNGLEPDLSFYTELRYEEPAEEIIKRFTDSLRALLKRLGEDLREGTAGEFAGSAQQLRGPLATAVERTTGHVDLIEALIMGAPERRGAGPMLRNVVANVVADANFSEVAETHVATPRAKEGKFDQERGGGITEILGEIADKLGDAADLIPVIGGLLKFIALLLKDVAMLGKATAEPARNEVDEQLEKKLDFIIPGVEMLKAGQQQISGVVGTTKTNTDETLKEVRRIEQKAETLGLLLGKTLVGEPWDVRPITTTVNKTPDKGVKEELHDLEDLLNAIINRLGPITDGPPRPPRVPPVIIRNVERRTVERVPVLQDARLKKIFVYAENTFTPQSRADRRTVRVETDAFDLSGWLDLSRLRSGDRFEVQVRVFFAGRNNVLFARTQFDSPGLKSFADFARGENFLSGSRIDIVMRQTASADNFATPIEAAYQFIVESQ
ncbi:MAG TPA: hypothetical protein VD861_03930 [Pyrinomonadaceae bacterium]|nr:hypothetical protein [Pyrinomonadaceae bacterium]